MAVDASNKKHDDSEAGFAVNFYSTEDPNTKIARSRKPSAANPVTLNDRPVSEQLMISNMIYQATHNNLTNYQDKLGFD